MFATTTTTTTTLTRKNNTTTTSFGNFPHDPIAVPIELRGVVSLVEEEGEEENATTTTTKSGTSSKQRRIYDLGSRVACVLTFTVRGMRGMSTREEEDELESRNFRRRRIVTLDDDDDDDDDEKKKKKEKKKKENGEFGKAIAIDLSIPTNPFFRYYCEIDESAFERMKEKQNITIDFESFLLALREHLRACKARESSNVMVFTMNDCGEATLVFLEDLGHKSVETLRIDFNQYSEREIRERVQLEYREMATLLYGKSSESAAPFAARRR
jgi:hypothetical protein